jgi:hypothetical protein
LTLLKAQSFHLLAREKRMNLHGHAIRWDLLVNFVPVLATIVTTFLSIVLARATLRYARTTDHMLEITREQFEREWAPELHIRMERASASDARLVVTNIAKASVLLQIVQFRNVSGGMNFEKQYLNDPLVGGTTFSCHVGEKVLKVTGSDSSGPIAASASFYSAGRLYRTDWFRFKVEVRGGRLEKIDSVTIPARRVRVLEPHKVRKFRKPLANDIAKELVESTRTN